jgi:predicted amidohydrolase
MLVAAFQKYPVFDDTQTATRILLSDLRWADARGVKLALFPECYLKGHAYDRPTIERRALALDGIEVQALLAQLASVQAIALIGLFERRGAALFNSVIVVEKGRLLGVYAKAHPNEDGVFPGREFPVFSTSGQTFGLNICNDANYPEAAQRVADRGATILCFALNNMLEPEVAEQWRGKSVENLQVRARQTGCWVVSADIAGRYGGLCSYGCSAIVRPDGAIVARAAEFLEDVALFAIS